MSFANSRLEFRSHVFQVKVPGMTAIYPQTNTARNAADAGRARKLIVAPASCRLFFLTRGWTRVAALGFALGGFACANAQTPPVTQTSPTGQAQPPAQSSPPAQTTPSAQTPRRQQKIPPRCKLHLQNRLLPRLQKKCLEKFGEIIWCTSRWNLAIATA